MCGILFTAAHKEQPEATSDRLRVLREALEHANAARGPDAQRRLELDAESPNETQRLAGLSLSFFASELLLRGDSMIVQPHHVENHVFCWNGEVFEGLDIGRDENDGAKLFAKLQQTVDAEGVRDIFAEIEGPYAFVYYQKSKNCLYFSRDPLGRRSLLIHKPNLLNPYIILGSVSVGQNPGYSFEELSTEGIFCLDLGSLGKSLDIPVDFESCLTVIPRYATEANASPFAIITRVASATPPDDAPLLKSLDDIPDYLVEPVDGLISQLNRSVMLQIRDIAKPKKVEGKASVAVLFSGGIDCTVLAFLAHRHVPPDEPIDLLNVAFENPRKIQFVANDSKRKKAQQPSLEVTGQVSYRVPDRVTGLTEVEELRRLCPGRVWNFVEIDVPYKEYQTAKPLVESTMFPGRTVMDLSLAVALYFASRGEGTVRSTPESSPEAFSSVARVLLNGLGSDELLGGYGRYRTAYIGAGWKAVIDELQLDLDRIPTRNLGRDDRIISSHGKETRHPFLSISVVNFVAKLPIQFKVDPRLEVGLGDKLLLRLAARKVGLVEASSRKKRAMQFGSCSARMSPGAADRRGDLTL